MISPNTTHVPSTMTTSVSTSIDAGAWVRGGEEHERCAYPLSVAARAPADLVDAFPPGGRGGAGVVVHAHLHDDEAEQRALEAHGRELDADQLDDVLAVHRGDLVERLADDLVGQDRHRRLADRAALAR